MGGTPSSSGRGTPSGMIGPGGPVHDAMVRARNPSDDAGPTELAVAGLAQLLTSPALRGELANPARRGEVALMAAMLLEDGDPETLGVACVIPADGPIEPEQAARILTDARETTRAAFAELQSTDQA